MIIYPFFVFHYLVIAKLDCKGSFYSWL